MKEAQNIEWKQSWRDECLKWVCGFANADGGMLAIGKNDRSEVVGVANAAKLGVTMTRPIYALGINPRFLSIGSTFGSRPRKAR